MIEYLIGVDGGGTGTRVRLARRDGSELALASAGPSGLAHGIAPAWSAILAALDAAFSSAGITRPALSSMAIGLGLAGVHNKDWATQFVAADPGFGALVLGTDGYSTVMGAHGGAAGAIVAIGTGSVGEALLPDGRNREVGGWGFPAGDEAGGAWMGLRAINHIEQVLDGRVEGGAFAAEVIAACGGHRDAIQRWLASANQTAYAGLARFVVIHGASDALARAILEHAGLEVAKIARALDPSGQLPLALCGGLGEVLLDWLPEATRARCRPALGDSAQGALRMIELHLTKEAQ